MLSEEGANVEAAEPPPPPPRTTMPPSGSKYEVVVAAAGGQRLDEALEQHGLDVLRDWHVPLDHVLELPATRLVSAEPQEFVPPKSMLEENARKTWVVPRRSSVGPFGGAEQRRASQELRQRAEQRHVQRARGSVAPGEWR